MSDTQIPADIVEMVDLLASIEGRTGNEYATRSTFDTSTVTTTQLAERLKALIDDLTAHGLIGP